MKSLFDQRIHNPAKVPNSQLGEGYRFLYEFEIKNRKKQSVDRQLYESIQMWSFESRSWNKSGSHGHSLSFTYRTKLSVEQLKFFEKSNDYQAFVLLNLLTNGFENIKM